MKEYVVYGLDLEENVYFEAEDIKKAIKWVNENLGDDVWDTIELANESR